MSLHTQRDLCKAWEKRFRSFLIQRGPGQVGLARSSLMNCLKWLIQVKVIFTDWVVGTTIIEVQTGRVLHSTFKIISRYLWRLQRAPTWKHDRNFCKRLVGEPRDRNCFTFWICVVRMDVDCSVTSALSFTVLFFDTFCTRRRSTHLSWSSPNPHKLPNSSR